MAAPHAQLPESAGPEAHPRHADVDLDAAQQLIQHSQEERLNLPGSGVQQRPQGDARPVAIAAEAATGSLDGVKRTDKQEAQADQKLRRPSASSTRASSQDVSSDAQSAPVNKAPILGQVCRFVTFYLRHTACSIFISSEHH